MSGKALAADEGRLHLNEPNRAECDVSDLFGVLGVNLSTGVLFTE